MILMKVKRWTTFQAVPGLHSCLHCGIRTVLVIAVCMNKPLLNRWFLMNKAFYVIEFNLLYNVANHFSKFTV